MDLKEKAKAIRSILKKEFPGVKFSVRKDGWSSINIRWTDGVPVKAVEKHVKKFESIDRCEMTGEILAGGNDYVFTDREISDENRAKVMEIIEKDHAEVLDKSRFDEVERHYIVGHVFETTDFRKPLSVTFKSGPSRKMLKGNTYE